MSRVIMDATDIHTGDKIYFTGHAQATYMQDGSTVEDNINNLEDKLDSFGNLNVEAVSAGENNDAANPYVMVAEFNLKMEEIGKLLDEINGLFTFYVDEISYKSAESMNWDEWLESSYNTHKYTIEQISNIQASDLIIPEYKYTTIQ